MDAVIEGISEHANALKVGPGIDPATTMGPLVSEAQQRRVSGFIDNARQEGVRVVAGGGRVDAPGYFVQPTVLVDETGDATVSREEIFGPVLVVTPFDNPTEIERKANATIYGLSANIWTRDVTAAYRLAKKIKAGTITVNSGMVVGASIPFGGFKQSGWGREGGFEGLSAFTETKSIITAI